MQNQPLVSIITPGYNCGAVVHRLLDSILAQTWQNIEFIFVNDGSTDNTAEVLDSYREKFAARGITMTVIYQENQGQAAAMNQGLAIFSGEYLCWVDADDYYEPESLERRVDFLERNPEYGCVTSEAYYRNSEDLSLKYLFSKDFVDNENPNQFELALCGKSIWCPGVHMIRASCFLRANPQRYIYPSREGQNWQILLPVYYHYPRYFLKEPLFDYLYFPNSHGHMKRTYQQAVDRLYGINTTYKETLQRIDMSAEERTKYLNVLHISHTTHLFQCSCVYKEKQMMKKYRKELIRLNAWGFQERKRYFEASNVLFSALLKCYRKLKKIIRKEK